MRSIILLLEIWLDFIVILWHLMLMQAKPQQLPAYKKLLILSSTFMVAMGILSALAIGLPSINLLESFVDLFFLLAFLKILLHLFHVPIRFTQTATAITGSIAMFSVLFIPLHFLAADMIGFGDNAQPEIQNSPMGAVVALIYFVLFIWMIRVLGHIFQHALEVRLFFAIGIALLYLVLVYLTSSLLVSTIVF